MEQRVPESLMRPRVEPVLHREVPLAAARPGRRCYDRRGGARWKDLAGERSRGLDGDLALERELVGRVPFPGVGPEQRPAGDLHELRADADAAVHTPERAVEHPVDAELPPDAIGAPVLI